MYERLFEFKFLSWFLSWKLVRVFAEIFLSHVNFCFFRWSKFNYPSFIPKRGTRGLWLARNYWLWSQQTLHRPNLMQVQFGHVEVLFLTWTVMLCNNAYCISVEFTFWKTSLAACVESLLVLTDHRVPKVADVLDLQSAAWRPGSNRLCYLWICSTIIGMWPPKVWVNFCRSPRATKVRSLPLT